VRDPALDDALRRLATEAATRFTTLVASGDEIPFDVAEAEGDSTFFHSYVPLTRRYVVDRSDEVRGLPSFGAACTAVAGSDVAAPYLETRGLPVPVDPAQRAAGMLVAFVAELWDGCAEFAIDRVRLDRALAELEAETRPLASGDALIAPVVGLKMPVSRIDLPNSVRIVRADAVEAPLELMSSEGMERSYWEPQYLAVAERREGDDPGAPLEQLRDLVSVLRLFKQGGVALGPYAFASTGDGKWRRVATGEPGTRPGGYRLSEGDADELARFAARLAERPDPVGALAWAVRRFELGCRRASAFDGLSDQLLALRALLGRDGAIGAGLPVRAGALIAGGGDREAASARIQEALDLELALMAGAEQRVATAPDLATWLEECVRTLLRDAALGELGADLGSAADESLIATGLQSGDGSAAEADEWDAFMEEELGEFDDFTVTAREQTAAPGRESEAVQKTESLGAPPSESEKAADVAEQSTRADSDVTRILEPIPQDTSEIRVSWMGAGEIAEQEEPEQESAGGGENFTREPREESEMADRDWLSEVSREERTTLEWPVHEEDDGGRERDRDREPIDTPRVRHLFPVPEDADWEVSELRYDRRRAGYGR